MIINTHINEHQPNELIVFCNGWQFDRIKCLCEAESRVFTPEQENAKRLGGGELTAEQIEKVIHDCSVYASYDGVKYYADGIRLQAIADELNAALGGGECEFVIEDNMNESEGMGDVWFRCTNCDTKFDYYADDWLMKQNFCPHCGCKIRARIAELRGGV